MRRTISRTYAFKLIFQIPFHTDFELGQAYEYLKEDFLDLNDEEKEFIYTEFKGTAENLDLIDTYITKNLKNWTIDRLEKEILALLRLAIYEMIFDKTIPPIVSINASLELAKIYSDEKGKKFINALLASVLSELECDKKDDQIGEENINSLEAE